MVMQSELLMKRQEKARHAQDTCSVTGLLLQQINGRWHRRQSSVLAASVRTDCNPAAAVPACITLSVLAVFIKASTKVCTIR